jgi:hypothetical protein
LRSAGNHRSFGDQVAECRLSMVIDIHRASPNCGMGITLPLAQRFNVEISGRLRGGRLFGA